MIGTREALAIACDRYEAEADRLAWYRYARPDAGRLALTTEDLRVLRRRTANVLALATGSLTDGAAWYGIAKGIADEAARAAGADRLPVFGRYAALAACSPGMPWHRNGDALVVVLRLALAGEDAREAITKALAADRVPVPYSLGFFVDAVRAAMQGDTTGPKRIAFAEGIATEGATGHVAVDGHAIAAADLGAVSTRPGISEARAGSGRQYALGALAYVLASERLREAGHEATPAIVQAAAWVAYRAIPIGRS